MKNKFSKDMKNINWRRKKILNIYRNNYLFDLYKLQSKNVSNEKDIKIKEADNIEIISCLQQKIINLLEENIQLNKNILELTQKNMVFSNNIKNLEDKCKIKTTDFEKIEKTEILEIGTKLNKININEWELITEDKS